jgi:hypothetical protein
MSFSNIESRAHFIIEFTAYYTKTNIRFHFSIPDILIDSNKSFSTEVKDCKNQIYILCFTESLTLQCELFIGK